MSVECKLEVGCPSQALLQPPQAMQAHRLQQHPPPDQPPPQLLLERRPLLQQLRLEHLRCAGLQRRIVIENGISPPACASLRRQAPRM